MSNLSEINIRPAVKRFAIGMENVLRKHDQEKGVTGWRDIDNQHLVNRLEANQVELKAAIELETPEQIMERCIDIANLAMMRYDNEFHELRKRKNND